MIFKLWFVNTAKDNSILLIFRNQKTFLTDLKRKTIKEKKTKQKEIEEN